MESSFFWDGTTIGDASLAPYSADEFNQLASLALTCDRRYDCVVGNNHPTYYTGLAAGVHDSNYATLLPGIGLVDGSLYLNDATVELGQLASSGNFYTIVLRKSWSSGTIRAAVLGPQAGTPPSVTQSHTLNSGTGTWEVALWTVQNSGGSLRFTDVRGWVQRPAIRTIFIPPSTVYNSTAGAAIVATTPQGFPLPDSAYSVAYGHFYVNEDFARSSATMQIFPVLQTATTTGLPYINVGAWAGRILQSTEATVAREDYTTHTGWSDLEQMTITNPLNSSWVQGILYEGGSNVDIGEVTEGDILTLLFQRDATHLSDTMSNILYFAGWLIKYVPRF